MATDFDYDSMTDREILIDMSRRVKVVERRLTAGDSHFDKVNGEILEMDKRVTALERSGPEGSQEEPRIKQSTAIKWMGLFTAIIAALFGIIEAVKAWG